MMTRYYCGAVFFAILIVLFIASPGSCSERALSQDILLKSKIRKSSIKKVFRDIKKTLPKEMKQCSIVVADIKLLKEKEGGVAEDWTVDICQETKVYLISTFHPKGYYCEVIPKEEALAQEKKYWNAAKKHGDEDFWRKSLLYVDELEAMDKGEELKNSE